MLRSIQILGLTIKSYGDPNSPIHSLEGTVQLPVWAGFQSRNGMYASIDNKEPSDGTIRLHLGSDKLVDQPDVSQEQLAAYQYLITNQSSVQKKILIYLLEQYPGLQEAYGYDPEEAMTLMPDVIAIEGFRNLIGLSTIHILDVAKDNIAYIGYEFGCMWDDEHGLGFMTHRERIIDLGGADSSFLAWIAEKDLVA